MRKSPKFSPEVVERAVRMVFDAKDQYPSQWAAIESIAAKIGCTAETLRKWVRRGERDAGVGEGPTTAEQQRVKELEREVRELRRARGVIRGKGVRTTRAHPKAPCPLDRVNREFRAERPNQLWVSDFT